MKIKACKIGVVSTLVAVTLAVAETVAYSGESQPGNRVQNPEGEGDGFAHGIFFFPFGPPETESPRGSEGATEAPTGFDNLSNGFLPQGPDFNTITASNVVSGASFNDDRFKFEEVEMIADGLGPTYNAQACRECHQNVVTGHTSQLTEHRTIIKTNGVFFTSMGGSIVQARATNPEIVEHVTVEDNILTFRIATTTLGDGFVEAIANETLLKIRQDQPPGLRGVPIVVPVLEATNANCSTMVNDPVMSPNNASMDPTNHVMRIGRFGWKSQHASLLSFAGDAYLNEMGITNPLFPNENLSNGRFVGFGSGFDPVPDPEDDGGDLIAFTGFMRSLKAPSRGPITPAVLAGEKAFNRIGCAVCHVPSIATAPAGTAINGGTFIVPPALGDKIIHPYSDFLGHDIGSSDGIPIQPIPQYAYTATIMRTAPLWGLRTINRLFHDGTTFTLEGAIQRHAGQATGVIFNYNALSDTEKTNVIAFLNSL